VKPEIGIAIEGGVTRDAPKVGPERSAGVAGRRPATFSVRFKRVPKPEIVALLKQTAKEKSFRTD